jgi:hypothetical protein
MVRCLLRKVAGVAAGAINQDLAALPKNAGRRGRVAAGVGSMRDMMADWKRWSRAERVFAVLVTFLMVALPLGLMLVASIGV